MARTKESKVSMREAFEGRLEKSQAVVVAEYAGITAEELADLRRQMRSVDCELRIVKNRVAKKALEAGSFEDMKVISQALVGPASIHHMYGDVAAGAKKLLDFSKSNEKLKVKSGVLDGDYLELGEIKKIADLPSKEVMMGQIVGSIIAPHRNLMYVLRGMSEKVVRCISQIHNK